MGGDCASCAPWQIVLSLRHVGHVGSCRRFTLVLATIENSQNRVNLCMIYEIESRKNYKQMGDRRISRYLVDREILAAPSRIGGWWKSAAFGGELAKILMIAIRNVDFCPFFGGSVGD